MKSICPASPGCTAAAGEPEALARRGRRERRRGVAFMRLHAVVVGFAFFSIGFSSGCERQPTGRQDSGGQEAARVGQTSQSTAVRKTGSVESPRPESLCVKEVECFSGIASDRCSILRSVIVSAAQTRIGNERSLCETFAGASLRFKVYDSFVDVNVDASAVVLKRLGLGALAVDWDDTASAFMLRGNEPSAPVSRATHSSR